MLHERASLSQRKQKPYSSSSFIPCTFCDELVNGDEMPILSWITRRGVWFNKTRKVVF